MNNDIRELSIGELDAVSGGAKGDSGALDAAKKIDLSAFLAQLDGPLPRPSRFKPRQPTASNRRALERPPSGGLFVCAVLEGYFVSE